MDIATLEALLAATKTALTSATTAQIALLDGTIQEYTIDTGQTRTRVTKLDMKALDAQIDSLSNRCATLEARLNGSGVTRVCPDF